VFTLFFGRDGDIFFDQFREFLTQYLPQYQFSSLSEDHSVASSKRKKSSNRSSRKSTDSDSGSVSSLQQHQKKSKKKTSKKNRYNIEK
jgi:hypothetical protein